MCHIASADGSDATVNTCSEGDRHGTSTSCAIRGICAGVTTDTDVIIGSGCHWELTDQRIEFLAARIIRSVTIAGDWSQRAA